MLTIPTGQMFVDWTPLPSKILFVHNNKMVQITIPKTNPSIAAEKRETFFAKIDPNAAQVRCVPMNCYVYRYEDGHDEREWYGYEPEGNVVLIYADPTARAADGRFPATLLEMCAWVSNLRKTVQLRHKAERAGASANKIGFLFGRQRRELTEMQRKIDEGWINFRVRIRNSVLRQSTATKEKSA